MLSYLESEPLSILEIAIQYTYCTLSPTVCVHYVISIVSWKYTYTCTAVHVQYVYSCTRTSGNRNDTFEDRYEGTFVLSYFRTFVLSYFRTKVLPYRVVRVRTVRCTSYFRKYENNYVCTLYEGTVPSYFRILMYFVHVRCTRTRVLPE